MYFSNVKLVFILYLVAVFILGGYMYVTGRIVEQMENQTPSAPNPSCYDQLFLRDGVILLMHSKLPIQNGVNPIPFHTLNDYQLFVEEQRAKGFDCPVLELQNELGTSTATGNPNYAKYLSTGLGVDKQNPVKIADASRKSGVFNKNMYPGIDSMGLYQGVYTEIDAKRDRTALGNEISDSAADPNWGGVEHTMKSIEAGKYKENEVTRPVFPKMGYVTQSIV